MFTGLVESCVPVLGAERRGTGLRLRLPDPGAPRSSHGGPDPAAPTGGGWPPPAPRIGDSIAVSGCCLTVVPPELGEGGALHFDLSAETLARTWFADLAPGCPVNLERALRIGDRLDGHLVTGHVDAVGALVEAIDTGDGGRRLTFEVPGPFERWLVDKGSVTVDGVSLTVVSPGPRRFDVAVIPHTLAWTSLGRIVAGQRVNLEADPVGKWVERLLAPIAPGGG